MNAMKPHMLALFPLAYLLSVLGKKGEVLIDQDRTRCP